MSETAHDTHPLRAHRRGNGSRRLSVRLRQQLLEDRPITLGELTACLHGVDEGLPVVFDFGAQPDFLCSWRGAYSDLSISPESTGELNTVSTLVAALRSADGMSFEGWKGGEFVMTATTHVWADRQGECQMCAVVGVRIETDRVVLVTLMLEDFNDFGF